MTIPLPTHIKALILDMDGVLWRDEQALLDMPAFFKAVKELDIQVVFATNNGTRSLGMYVERLLHFGVRVEPWQVVTSAIATADYLAHRFPQGGPVTILGETGVIEALAEKGFYPAGEAEEPLAVVAGMYRSMNYERLAEATLLIRSGKPFIGTNPDLTFPTPRGQVPGAGAILKFLEVASDVQPVMIGKPEPYLYRFSIERLCVKPEEVLAVGDRYETDIIGGQRTGCPTVLVLSGVTSPAQAAQLDPPPTLTLPNLADLLPVLRQQS